MAYDGEVVYQCLPVTYFAHDVQVVIVSGDGMNVCGHALPYSGFSRRYFHVGAGIHEVPRTMNEQQFQRYMREHGKREIHRYRVVLTDPLAAHRKVEQLLSEKWFWGGLPHNCVHFAEQVVTAGGSHAGMWFNCPRAEYFK
jgi:hypothetical protein